jgi:hypothetical protein
MQASSGAPTVDLFMLDCRGYGVTENSFLK